MTSENGDARTEIAEIAQVAAAERIAAAVVSAFNSCEESGIELSEVQKIALIEAMLLQFDGFADQLRTIERVGRLIEALGHS